jgi:hypothetical protein
VSSKIGFWQREIRRDSTIKNAPIRNIGLFSIVEVQGFLKAINPIFELTSV